MRYIIHNAPRSRFTLICLPKASGVSTERTTTENQDMFHAVGADMVAPAALIASADAGEAGAWPHLLNQYLPDLSQRITTTVMPTQQPAGMSTSSSSSRVLSPGGSDADTSSVCSQPRNKGTCNAEEQRW